MRSNGSIAWPNSDVWSASDWVMTHRGSNYTIFVPVRDGEEAVTLKQSGYALNIIAEQLAFTASAQGDLFATIDSPSKTYSTKCMNC